MKPAEAAERAKLASVELAKSPPEVINEALRMMASRLSLSEQNILEANAEDLRTAERAGISAALLDRLRLDQRRVSSMVAAIQAVSEQPDPVGEVVEEWTRPNGLQISKIRSPLGVVAVIYEARPNVTADVAALCLRSHNASVLRGSSHALQTNIAVTEVLREAVTEAGLPEDSLVLITDTSREAAVELMAQVGKIDLLVPRGGPSLIASVLENSKVPYIIDGDGNCHVYVDKSADLDIATRVVVNAKVSRPSVCNAAETLLVHRDVADEWLPEVLPALTAEGVEVRGDDSVRAVWPQAEPASEEDWATEYLDVIIAVKVVSSADEAIDHINHYGTMNAEAIIAADPGVIEAFTSRVDSGTLFVNASTRFSDGGEFGFGAEIGISTQKLHARGPMGARELTSLRYIVRGDGQIRT